MAFVTSVHAKAIALIKLALDMTTAAGSGHPTSAASLVHVPMGEEVRGYGHESVTPVDHVRPELLA